MRSSDDRPKVYLAGPITGQSYAGAVDWREYAIEQLAVWGIAGVSPMRGKRFLLEETRIGDHYPEHVLANQKAITTRDRWDVRRADVVLANLVGAEQVSIGTMIELGWADAARVPIVLVMEPGNVHDHAMVRELAGYRVEELDHGLALCRVMLCLDHAEALHGTHRSD